jgi:hypothetical protein
MELLAEEIRKNGFIYRFLKRGNKSLVYEQIEPDTERIVAWEVFKIKVDKPKVVFGIQLNEREIFPGNEDFGKWAWAHSDFDSAMSKFEFLENVEDE